MKRFLTVISLILITICTSYSQKLLVIDNDTVAIFNSVQLKKLNMITAEHAFQANNIDVLTEKIVLKNKQLSIQNDKISSLVKVNQNNTELIKNKNKQIQNIKNTYETELKQLRKENKLIKIGGIGALVLGILIAI